MQLEFQLEVLKFFCQDKTSKQYVEVLKPELFDVDSYYAVFSLLKAYREQYKHLPGMAGLTDFAARSLRSLKKPMDKEERDRIFSTIKEAHKPMTSQPKYIRETLIEEYQKQQTIHIFSENAPDVNKGGEPLKNILKSLADLHKLTSMSFENAEKNRGEFLLRDYKMHDYEDVKGHPTYLHDLNRLTGTGGFSSPELVIIMTGPKGFKTGTCLNLALGYVRYGFKVFYADTENGHKKLNRRMKQAMLQATAYELQTGEHEETLAQVVKQYSARGGDFKPHFFPAYQKTMEDVDEELAYLKEEENWEPDIIFFDNLDNFLPIIRQKERRLQIQHVYFDAINLLDRRSCFGFSPSQVNRDAVNKDHLDMTAFAEDFGKAANCHAAFAICQDKIEKYARIARIVPVVQREGVDNESGEVCYVKIDKKRMYLGASSEEEHKKAYDKAYEEMLSKGLIDMPRVATKKGRSTRATKIQLTEKQQEDLKDA